MTDILSTLFYGEVAPFETLSETTPASKELYERYKECRDAFESKLPDDLKDPFDEIISLRVDLGTCYAKEAFKLGFRLAVRLLADSISEQV